MGGRKGGWAGARQGLRAMRAVHRLAMCLVLATVSHSADLRESRQAVADLWTHTEGPPRGQTVSIDLPESDSAEVEKIVAAKKVEVAAAGLHHATVQLKAAQDKKAQSDEDAEG